MLIFLPNHALGSDVKLSWLSSFQALVDYYSNKRVISLKVILRFTTTILELFSSRTFPLQEYVHSTTYGSSSHFWLVVSSLRTSSLTIMKVCFCPCMRALPKEKRLNAIAFVHGCSTCEVSKVLGIS